MPKSEKKNNNIENLTRIIDLLERLGVVALYLGTDLNHQTIARRLKMRTKRVTTILKGLKKPPKKQHAEKTK